MALIKPDQITLALVLYCIVIWTSAIAANNEQQDHRQCKNLGLSGDARALCRQYCERLNCPETPSNPPALCNKLGDRLLNKAADQGVTLHIQQNIVQCQALPPFPENDSSLWVCPGSLTPTKPLDIEKWCLENTNRGLSLPRHLQTPVPITDLDAKNIYDLQMDAFLKSAAYKRKGGPDALAWFGDTEWRFTGPVVGNFTAQTNPSSFATHIPVKLWYSPEMVDWYCAGRVGEIPAGAAIIKELRLVNNNLDVTLDNEGCMNIESEKSPVGWTVMVRAPGYSRDGWYWPVTNLVLPKNQPGLDVDPPVFDLSGITRPDFYSNGNPPENPDPAWYPSGYWPTNAYKFPNVIEPQNAFTPFCIACHSSAEKHYTFSSIENILGNSIKYKQFAPIPNKQEVIERAIHVPPGSEFPPPEDEDLIPPLVRQTPFTVPKHEPEPIFLALYDQLAKVSFVDVWPHRFPAKTWDRILPATDHKKNTYLTSNMCFSCHDAFEYLDSTGNMLLDIDDDGSNKVLNLSPSGELSASPMGQAGRDPIFFSQLQSETNNLPDLTECIETTCLKCHGVMGQRQLALDTPGQENPACEELIAVPPPVGVPLGKSFRKQMLHQWPGALDKQDQQYGALARDGISCTVCHRISATGLGTESTFTGNFVATAADQIFGPYKKVSTKPMQNAVGITPQFNELIRDSEVCGTCHAILLPVYTNEGERVKFSYEQTTYLEWQNSDFSHGLHKQECQNCHMPRHYKGEELAFKIANSESGDFPPTSYRLPDAEISVTERDEYARHSLHGLNLFLNQMFQQYPILLGDRQGTPFVLGSSQVPPLLLGAESMIDMAKNQTADVEVVSFKKQSSQALKADIKITNRTGHYLPSGVSFRRLFIEVLIQDRHGKTLWASGRTNKLGFILDGMSERILPSEQPVKFPDAPYQPHYQRITKGDQVQIYQELIKDSSGDLTTSFLRRLQKVKDNRIRPQGFDPAYFLAQDSPYIRELARTPGRAGKDPDYIDPNRTGADEISYVIKLEPKTLRLAHKIQVTLYSQSIPPFYLQQRFNDANKGPAEKTDIERLYYMTSHLNVDQVTDNQGNPVMGDWKLLLNRTRRELMH